MKIPRRRIKLFSWIESWHFRTALQLFFFTLRNKHFLELFFFLMWTIFKIFIELFTILLLFSSLAHWKVKTETLNGQESPFLVEFSICLFVSFSSLHFRAVFLTYPSLKLLDVWYVMKYVTKLWLNCFIVKLTYITFSTWKCQPVPTFEVRLNVS